MIKIEASTLEEAFKNAASTLECSVTELKVEVVQYPSKGMFGLFKKNAVIVATTTSKQPREEEVKPQIIKKEIKREEKQEDKKEKPQQTQALVEKKVEVKKEKIQNTPKPSPEKIVKPARTNISKSHNIINDTIMPASFVSDQDDYEDDFEGIHYTADYDDVYDNNDDEIHVDMHEIAKNVAKDINKLFDLACFNIDKIDVSAYDENTLLVEFRGEDAALLIGKEGYRYKALSYMIFNWINAKYQVQLRLEIAEFLKNQEESITRYLVNVCEIIDKDGRAQTKILDGVLIQIALRELRERYPEKYVVIRSTRDGLKYIIVNDYHTN
ncbi:MAG: Jag N-terminal domain-containing protein [Sulfurimonas sp.]|nr:Jag N-terminal domain-containing protein [Sulfurimonas sp.]